MSIRGCHLFRREWLRRAAVLTFSALVPLSAPAENPTDEQRAEKAAAARAEARVVIQGAVASEPVWPVTTGRNLRDAPTLVPWKPGDPIKEIPRRDGGGPAVIPGPPANPTSWVRDPLLDLQDAVDKATGVSRAFTTPAVNIAGLAFNGSTPPDTVGDVGPSHYIQMLNGPGGSSVAAWNKDGSPDFGPVSLAPALGMGICATGAGDPIVLYDRLADRWLLTEFSGAGNALCVYVSQTPDPGGAYFTYVFNTPNFPDYPKYAVWPDGYYVSSNEDGPPAVYALERNQMLAGLAATVQRFTAPNLAGFGFQALTPGDLDGAAAPPVGSPAYFMRHRDDEVHNAGSNNPSVDFLEIWEFSVDWATPANSTFTGPTNIPMTEIDSDLCGLVSFMCFPQPSGQQLDPLREVIMWRLQYRNFGTYETLVGNLTTDVDGTDHGGIRWFELRKAGAGGWALEQEGTYAPDGDNRWMGSIAMNAQGDLAIGYSVASLTQSADIRYIGRKAADAPGTLTTGETVLAAGSGSWGANRWGDYSAMSVDPVDDCTFWHTHMYSSGGGQWATRIGAFRFDSCGGPPGDCGNGVLDAGEGCDDGNAFDGDGCSSVCQVEEGYVCTDPTPGADNVIADPSFEAGTPNPAWGETSTNFGTPLCDAGCGGPGGTDGAWYAWFGGIGAFEQATLEQAVTIPVGATTLSFDLQVGVCDSPADFFDVRIDGIDVFTTDPCTADTGYDTQSVDISGFADGGPHALLLDSVSNAVNGGNSNFFVDNLVLGAPPQPSICTLDGTACFAEDFNAGIASLAAWTRFDTGPLSLDWGTTDDGFCGSASTSSGNHTGGTGEAACIDSDAAGNGEVNSYLCSPPFEVDPGGSELGFLYNYQIFSLTAEDAFEVLIGNAAPSPATIGSYDSLRLDTTAQGTFGSPPGVAFTEDLSAYGGEIVHLCFRYGANFDWYAQVDDIVVSGCAVPDSDEDGLADNEDNCIFEPNGPAMPDAGGNVQLDTDGDGIGNACDADLTNDCNVNFGDLADLKSVFFPRPYAEVADFNGDGLVNFGDLALMKSTFFNGANPGPGPSGIPNICSPP